MLERFKNFDYFIVSNIAAVAVDKVPDVCTGNILVPSTFQTSTGALYKARSLQYCLIDGNQGEEDADDEDYCLILDEDVQLTVSAARGVVYFMACGYDVGDGLYSSLQDQWGLMEWTGQVPGIIFEAHRTGSYLAAEFLKKSGAPFVINAYGGFQMIKVGWR